jgi:Leucine-rich repeat (LRR) protein
MNYAVLQVTVLGLLCQLPGILSNHQSGNRSDYQLNDLIAIQRLNRSHFDIRQQAMEELMSRPTTGLIELLEKAAMESDLEKSSRAIQVLAHFATDDNLYDQARKALRRLSKIKTYSSVRTTVTDSLTRLEHRQQSLNRLFRNIDRDDGGAVVGLRMDGFSNVGLRELKGLLGSIQTVRKIHLTEMPQGVELERLESCRALEELCLNNVNIDDTELGRLPPLPGLKLLAFKNCDLLSENSVYQLPEFPELTSLELSKHHTPGLKRLDEFEQLTVLICDASNMSDDDCAQLQSLTRLKELSLNNAVNVTDRGFSYLNQLKHLEHVCVTNAAVSNDCLAALLHLPLKSLTITGVALSDDCIMYLVKHKNLETLSLSDTNIGDHGVQVLVNSLKLRSLNLTKTRVTDKAMLTIANCPNMKKLVLMYTDVSDSGLNALAQSESLEELVLTGTKITDLGVGGIASKSLRFLNVSNCDVSWHTIDSVRRKTPSLNILMVSR